jgi:xanthine dehydrogenase small subunit
MQPGELIESVRIPLPVQGHVFKVYKLSKRFDQDISTVVAAFSIAIENGVVCGLRAAFGGMAAQAARAKHV